MTELDLIVDLHRNSDRQGPGSETETLKALGFMDLPAGRALRVADIGCGTGGQTLTLARRINGTITAIDIIPAFLEKLNQSSYNLGLGDKIHTLEKSMDNLPFHKEELDIIWSEGAIYTIGFSTGINNWKHFLKPGGYLAVSEITWITTSRPKEIEDFWIQEYPEIDVASNKIRILEDNGFTLKGYFNLAQTSWTENYYQPLEAVFGSFLERNGNSSLAQKVAEEYKAEIDLYRKYKDYYSYGFYIAQKN